VFFKNRLFLLKDKNSTFRIVHIDVDYSVCYCIDIFTKKGLPIPMTTLQLEYLERIGQLEFIDKDPHLKFFRKDFELNEREKKHWVKAKENYDLIMPLIEQSNTLLNSKLRGKFIKEHARIQGVSEKHIYHTLRRYWQRGMCEGALLPDYNNSGAPGVERVAGDVKRGRPIKYPHLKNNGTNVTEAIKKIFKVGYQLYESESKFSLYYSYKEIMNRFFRDKNGELLEVRPSFDEYSYYYKKDHDVVEKIKNKEGENIFNLKHRAILGSSMEGVVGPGDVYQIDSTTANIYLVSEDNKNNIIGRPVIYFIVDVFSRYIAGMYIALEGPSWQVASMALINMAGDKVEYCKRFGIDIEEEQWKSGGLPKTIIADRGEFASLKSDPVIQNLNIHVELKPPFRADLKGIVEQSFNVTHERVKPLLPGFVLPDHRLRGGEDYRLDAKLTLKEFTNVIIKSVLLHNNKKLLKSYVRENDMIHDNIPPIPNQLWNWGLMNGKLRYVEERFLKMAFLPEYSARITEYGIKVEGLHYVCDRATKEFWFDKARINGKRTIKICLDPRDVTYAYLMNETKTDFELCTLLPRSMKYNGLTLEEVQYFEKLNHMQIYSYERESEDAEINYVGEINDYLNQTMTNKPKTSISISNAEAVRNIKPNKNKEKLKIQKTEAFRLVENTEEVLRDENLETSSISETSFLNTLIANQEVNIRGRK